MESFPEEKVEKFGTQTPVNRAAMPKEYGPAFVFLACNEDSSMISGEVRLAFHWTPFPLFLCGATSM